MPRKSQAASAEECCAKCERDVAALRKEVAALKAALAKRPSSGDSDARVDRLWEAVSAHPAMKKILEK